MSIENCTRISFRINRGQIKQKHKLVQIGLICKQDINSLNAIRVHYIPVENKIISMKYGVYNFKKPKTVVPVLIGRFPDRARKFIVVEP